MLKRGKDHTWQLVKYKVDLAIYAKCKCGFHYCCSTDSINEDGSRNPAKQEPTRFYRYCPVCGARKKYYTTDITKIDKYECEDWNSR